MNCDELQKLLDAEPGVAGGEPGAEPGEEDAAIQSHTKECESCRQELSAARLARVLIAARAGETIEPPPYFAARVAALAWDRRSEFGSSLVSMWRASRLIVSSILTLIVILFALNFGRRPLTPRRDDPVGGQYSLEQVIVEDSSQQGERALSNAQVMDSLFEAEDNDGSH